MRKNRLLSLLMMAAMLATTAVFTACSDSDDKISEGPVTPAAGAFSYRATLYGNGDSKNVALDSLTAAVTSIECNASWLTAALLPDLDYNQHQVINVVSTSDNGDEATVTVTAENGEKATITVRHGDCTDGDAYSGANANFLTDWWKCKDVNLVGYKDPQYTPWNPDASANIPDEVRRQGDPADGWEMAFCYLNNPKLAGVRYFALYNKWTGQMRVYTYIENPGGWGSDLTLNAYFGYEGEQNMYPMYNLFEYGIPTCHVPGSTLQNRAKLLSSQAQTFQTWLTPFSKSKSLSPGWYCFEYDMSGFVPKGKDWLKLSANRPRFQFFAETRTDQSVTLKGKLTGTIDGTYTEPQNIQHGGANATSGILSTLGSMLTGVSGMASSSISGANQYATAMKNDPGSILTPVKYWGGFACSIAGGVLSLASSLAEDPITYEHIPGSINLTLDASMSLDGYISGVTSNSLPSLSVSAEGVNSANGSNGHVGKGVWSLAEDPVVYIDRDDIISSESSFNLQCTPTGYYINTFQNYNARIVYAFDPTSVKLNINTDLFRDIQDVTVTANVGVFPNQPYGHTDRYRRMLMLGERPSFRLSSKTSGHITMSANSEPLLSIVGLNSLADGEYETAENCTIVTQKTDKGTGWQRFHGRLIDLPEIGKQIMVEPQVFIPYDVDGSGNANNIGFPTAPDFVVRVDVQFTALDDKGQRKLFQFGKLYIPKIELVSYEKMNDVKDRLKAYSEACKKKEPINSLANDPKVKVRFPGGDRLTAKTLRLLDRIL